ncbi:MAG: molybdenum cofactor biosynthesis protein MoaE [Nevskia sp.]|nr:molybdenum cofactor biosynthesis protein MoaE [Nevskia sp.]
MRQGALNPAEFLGSTPPDCGGTAAFVGTVRNEHDGRAVTGIRYHAYAPLAERRLEQVEQEAQRRFGVRVRVAHAFGELVVGDASVVVVAQAGHRAEAFDACRWAIDTIKQSVPIWKEERYAGGEARFLEGTPIREVGQA